MRTTDLIAKKRDGGELTADEIRALTLGYSAGEIPDYQMSAFLMAVVWRGMTRAETYALTDAMVESGATLDLSKIDGIKLDKHSTGGIGDKVTMAVVPLLAAAGVPIAKMSGRGLGHTGGTIDKLECIPGFRTQLTAQEILDQVERIGACICAQTDDLVPADRKMYALRDVTATVDSIPLIAASIMSKKLACGADAILLDVKLGSGAFMKALPAAEELAQTLVDIAQAHGRRAVACITDMNAPLGHAVGNWVEVREVADLLMGAPIAPRLYDEVEHFTRIGLRMAGRDPGDFERLLSTGKGFEKFCDIIAAQGGNLSVFGQEVSAPINRQITAGITGTVQAIDALAIGEAAMTLGAGRAAKDSSIDPLAGVVLDVAVGSFIHAGDRIATLFTSDSARLDESHLAVARAIAIAPEPAYPPPLVYETIGDPSRGAA